VPLKKLGSHSGFQICENEFGFAPTADASEKDLRWLRSLCEVRGRCAVLLLVSRYSTVVRKRALCIHQPGSWVVSIIHQTINQPLRSDYGHQYVSYAKRNCIEGFLDVKKLSSQDSSSSMFCRGRRANIQSRSRDPRTHLCLSIIRWYLLQRADIIFKNSLHFQMSPSSKVFGLMRLTTTSSSQRVSSGGLGQHDKV
jgi:hypothetical protein